MITIALCILDEAIEQAGAEPMPPSLAIRLALATLFHLAPDARREDFDTLWRELRNPYAAAWSDEERKNLRMSYARTAYTGIARAVGIEPTAAVNLRLRQIRLGQAERK